MDKEHFLIDLKLYLRQLPTNEQLTILADYERLFEEQAALGKTDYEITKELPSPKMIAMTVLNEANIPFKEQPLPSSDWEEFSYEAQHDRQDHPYMEQAAYHQQKDSAFIRSSQIIGLFFLNFLFMFWAILTILLLILSGWIVVVSFIVSPVAGLFLLGSALSTYSWFQFFISLILLGCGIIASLILKPITKGVFKLIGIYTKWNMRVLKGGRSS